MPKINVCLKYFARRVGCFTFKKVFKSKNGHAPPVSKHWLLLYLILTASNVFLKRGEQTAWL